MSNFIRLSVSIRKDQKEWLDKHPEINVSGLLQKAIDELREKYEGSD
ncbi:MAG: hypothetical protein J7L63_02420 [Thermoplasmata archaeon]|nr:hypothetical protein [Thermoplasmata archaeon]